MQKGAGFVAEVSPSKRDEAAVSELLPAMPGIEGNLLRIKNLENGSQGGRRYRLSLWGVIGRW